MRVFISFLSILALWACKTHTEAPSGNKDVGGATLFHNDWFQAKNALFDPHSISRKTFMIQIAKYKDNNPENYTSKEHGSGFLIDKNGYFITNYHVLESCIKILNRTHPLDVSTWKSQKSSHLIKEVLKKAVLNKEQLCPGYAASFRGTAPAGPKQEYQVSIVSNYPQEYSLDFDAVIGKLTPKRKNEFSDFFQFKRKEIIKSNESVFLEDLALENATSRHFYQKVEGSILSSTQGRVFLAGFSTSKKYPKEHIAVEEQLQSTPVNDFTTKELNFSTGKLGRITTTGNYISFAKSIDEGDSRLMITTNVIDAHNGASGGPLFENSAQESILGVINMIAKVPNTQINMLTTFISAIRIYDHYFQITANDNLRLLKEGDSNPSTRLILSKYFECYKSNCTDVIFPPNPVGTRTKSSNNP